MTRLILALAIVAIAFSGCKPAEDAAAPADKPATTDTAPAAK